MNLDSNICESVNWWNVYWFVNLLMVAMQVQRTKMCAADDITMQDLSVVIK